MIQLLKRYREIVVTAVALVVPLFVYFAHARHPGARNAFDRAVVRASRPAEWLVGRVITGAGTAWYEYVALRHARGDARRLSSEVNRLAMDRMELQAVRAENERLRRLLGFAPGVAEGPLVGARVIGVQFDPKGLQLLTVDRGSDQGLQRMMPVVAAQGVVGRIHSVLPGSADVLVLTDRNSSVAVRVARSRARANVRGSGDPTVARLDFALRADDFLEGDLLVTSGTDGVFPPGLPVGRIQGLKKGGQGLYQHAEVLPAADVTKVEEVLILAAPREEAAAARLGPP